MTESQIYFIISAFQAKKKVEWHKRPTIRIHYHTIIALLEGLVNYDSLLCGTWYIDGEEII